VPIDKIIATTYGCMKSDARLVPKPFTDCTVTLKIKYWMAGCGHNIKHA
jgi:hypothetical protein